MYEDKVLVCKECGEEFVFTAGEQEFYAEKGFENEPGVAQRAELHVSSVEVLRWARGRCTTPCVQIAERSVRYRSDRAETGRSTVGSVSRREGQMLSTGN